MTGAPCCVATSLNWAGIGFDATVEKGNEARGLVGDRKIVGYQDDRLTRRVEAVEGIDDDMTVGGVQIAGGLVGEYDIRCHEQRPCDRHPLLLTAGELCRDPLGQSSQAELIQQIHCAAVLCVPRLTR